MKHPEGILGLRGGKAGGEVLRINYQGPYDQENLVEVTVYDI